MQHDAAKWSWNWTVISEKLQLQRWWSEKIICNTFSVQGRCKLEPKLIDRSVWLIACIFCNCLTDLLNVVEASELKVYESASCKNLQAVTLYSGLSLEGDLGQKVSFSWLTSPYFELREKFKCIEHIGKSKIWTKIMKMSRNFSLSESSRLTPEYVRPFLKNNLFAVPLSCIFWLGR